MLDPGEVEPGPQRRGQRHRDPLVAEQVRRPRGDQHAADPYLHPVGHEAAAGQHHPAAGGGLDLWPQGCVHGPRLCHDPVDAGPPHRKGGDPVFAHRRPLRDVAPCFDQHHRHLVERRHPQRRVEGGPEFGQILALGLGGGDPDPLHLIGQIGGHQQEVGGPELRDLGRTGPDVQRRLDIGPRQDRVFVQPLHPVPEQDRRRMVARPGGGQHHMQVERQPRAAQPRPAAAVRGQTFVGVPRVLRDLPQIEVERVAGGVFEQGVGRGARDADVAQAVERG
jgi:hypothetical protein